MNPRAARRHQDGAAPYNKQPVLLELRNTPGHPDEHEGPDHDARQASDPAEDHDGERLDRDEELKLAGFNAPIFTANSAPPSDRSPRRSRTRGACT